MAISGLIICFGSSVPSPDWINELKAAAIEAAAIISKACTLPNEMSPIYNTDQIPTSRSMLQYCLQLSYRSGRANYIDWEARVLCIWGLCFLKIK